jgi:hypothetical protein
MSFAYDPNLDGDADPGEVVWTWVPYEEDAAQGKDRPAVVIGRDGDDVLIVPLSSKNHDERVDHNEWVPLGSGNWDADGRVSYADIGRVLRVAPDSIRREGAILERERFDAVVAAVEARA